MSGAEGGGRDDRTGGVVLGVSCDYHDAAAAVIVDGAIVAAAEEERFSRIKHDPSLPQAAVASCLELCSIAPDDIDVAVFYERPLSVAHRYVASKRRAGPASLRTFTRDAPRLVAVNLAVGYRLERMLRTMGRRRELPVRYSEHHLSHAAAAFFPSPFERAAVLTVDGIGEWTTASIALGHRNRLEILEELRYPDSVGLLYSLITHWCGFTPNDGEYKVMGLAPYGEPAYLEQLGRIVRVMEDGSIELDARALGWFAPRGRTARRLADLLGGPPRPPDAPLGRREADLAASIQVLTETVMLRLAQHAHERTGMASLCMAGGVALNSVANGRVSSEGPFDDVWIQPAAGDSGSAIGAALAHWHLSAGAPREPIEPDGMSGAFLGPASSRREVAEWLAASGVGADHHDDTAMFERVARALAGGAVVGWFRGRMEFGPRALGHRSILADPRSPTIARRLNVAVKGRESFRPFAPAVLAEEAAEWFQLDQASPYMLLVVPLRGERLRRISEEPDDLAERAAVCRSDIPACTHVDGTARVQTVDRRSTPAFHALITAFRDLTGVPILLNTSFNRAGEPIVRTPQEALDTARRIGLDLLVVEDRLIDLGHAVTVAAGQKDQAGA